MANSRGNYTTDNGETVGSGWYYPAVTSFQYRGSGTDDDPYLVTWIPDDPRNPMNFDAFTRWLITGVAAFATLAVALVSSAYSGGVAEIMADELFGRQLLFFVTYGALTAFNAGCAGAQNCWTLIILRFFAGAFGSSPLTNAGGIIADMFPAAQRGVGIGWRWIMGACLIPETYAPVLLRQRAAKLSAMNRKRYVSIIDYQQGRVSPAESFKTALSKPWILLFKEPIVFLMSLYMAIIYGTLYMLFAAFPIVFQQNRGWSAGIGGLAFLGILVDTLFAISYTFPDNNRYIRVQQKHGAFAPPEARLPPTSLVPFGFGMVLIFLSVMNYLVDSYTIFAASVLAASSVIRSLFEAAFPLFTTYMYVSLGIHWASSIPAFLALVCVPFPYLFYKYGSAIRKRCKYAAQSAAFMEKLQETQTNIEQDETEEKQVFSETDRNQRPASVSASETGTADSAVPFEESKRISSRSCRRASGAYEGNPYNIDRVNTRESFA
ncbi:hypothetical protein AAE478_003836 [Parahypoxylon ruwenzoriense]